MTNKFELYKCNICGNIIEILISGDGHPVCCGEEMERLEAKNDNLNSPDMTEKHTLTTEKTDNGYVLTLPNHPMEEKHYIMFTQIISKDKTESKIKYFQPHQEVKMTTDINSEEILTKSYCNIHGVYTGK